MNVRTAMMYLSWLNPNSEIQLVFEHEDQSTCQIFGIKEILNRNDQTVVLLVEEPGVVDV